MEMLKLVKSGSFDTHNINKKNLGGVLLVIPMLVINPLPQKFNWRLGTIFLLGWHTEVIHKYHRLFVHWWSVHTFTTSGVKINKKIVLINSFSDIMYSSTKQPIVIPLGLVILPKDKFQLQLALSNLTYVK